MRVLLRLRAILTIAIKRIFSQIGLAAAAIVGLIVAVALTMSIPVYAEAVYYRTFLDNIAPSEETLAPRPPYAFMFYYGGGLHPPVQWEDTRALDQYMTESAAGTLGLPQEILVRHFRTEVYRMFPRDTTRFTSADSALAFVRFGSTSGIEEHIDVFEGQFPSVASMDMTSDIEVMIPEKMAVDLGLQVGEGYTLFVRNRDGNGIQQTLEIPILISGVWRPIDLTERYWFFNPSFLDNQLIVPEETLSNRIREMLPDEVYAAIWYMVMNGEELNYSIAAPLVERINALEADVRELLPNTRLALSPREDLVRFQREANVLTILLYTFGIPIIGLLLAFVGLTASLAMEQRRNEIAVLRSRGAMAAQMVGVAALEALLLGAVALAAGSPGSTVIARLMGQSRSFLDFSAATDLRTAISTSTLLFGTAIIGLAIAAQVFPTLGASRFTIITYKQQRARTARRPLWQRMWLDVLLFIPAAYGAYLLRQQGSIADTTLSRNPFENPLLFLVPALGIFAMALFCLRLLPYLMGAISWLASQTKSISLLMASRHLSRTPGFYFTPLLLLILTLSLSAFTASLAESLDNQLYDQKFYSYGADVTFQDFGEDTQAPVGGFGAPPPPPPTGEAGPRWRFLPVSDYLSLTGAQAVSRVGAYDANVVVTGRTVDARFMGVDRYDFGGIAFWRSDFAQDTLGTLMNALAFRSDGVLVSRQFMQEYAYSVDDLIRIRILAYGERYDLDLQIVGVFDLWPSWYPEEDGPLFVGNLDYFFQQIGSQIPYQVWMKVDPAIGSSAFKEANERSMISRGISVNSPVLEIDREQRRPERQGLFGLLSVGFGAAAVLTVVGFLLYALFSFRRRFIEMGVLRAVGLSARQMVAFLTWELAFLIIMGALIGTLLGAIASAAVIPYLQINTGVTSSTPPSLVEIAWPAIFRIYALFGILFVVALVALAALLRRMKIFQAIKLGETT